jgi:hypothetical protein
MKVTGAAKKAQVVLAKIYQRHISVVEGRKENRAIIRKIEKVENPDPEKEHPVGEMESDGATPGEPIPG